MKSKLFAFLLAIANKAMPFFIYLVRKSPALQTLAFRLLSENELIRRAAGQIGASVLKFDEIVNPGSSNTSMDYFKTWSGKSLWIVIPIFNAFESTKRCLEAVVKTTEDSRVTILLINDSSSDPRIAPLLLEYDSHPNILVHTNSINVGYTSSVNLGLRMAGRSDVILLNSDTVVTGKWHLNLRYAAYSGANIASATAVSNNAGAFSVVDFQINAQGIDYLDRLGRLYSKTAEGRILQVPTGNGFCIYLRRDALDDVGLYDETKYSRGYGEENDFAMRALRSGWQSVVCDKAFVFHETSQSFGEEKKTLLSKGLRQLSKDYPEYDLMTRRFFDGEFRHVRDRFTALKRSDQNIVGQKRRILYIMPIVGGGLPATNADLIDGLDEEYEPFVLTCRGNRLTLFARNADESNQEVIWSGEMREPVNPLVQFSDEYDKYLADIIYKMSIDILHVEHMAWQSMGITKAAKAFEVPIIFTLHDYFSICPSHNLLDDKGIFCGGSCTATKGQCQIDIWPSDNLPNLKQGYIKRWQELNLDFLNACSKIISPSESAKEVLLNKYPELREKVLVVPHQRHLLLSDFTPEVSSEEKIRVLIIGNIGASKGAYLIEQLHSADKGNTLDLHFLGDTWPNLKKIGTHHGTYDRETVVEKIVAIGPQVGLLLSIWGETFSHTLTELIAAGIPVAAIDLGAIGERVKGSQSGITFDPNIEGPELVRALNAFCRNNVEYEKVIENIKSFKREVLAKQSAASMASQYETVYLEFL